MIIVRRSKVKWPIMCSLGIESTTCKIVMYYILCTHHAYKIPPLYMLWKKKPITICKHEGYLSQARPIISYFKTVCVYNMTDLNSMVFMFKLTTICFQIIYVKLL